MSLSLQLFQLLRLGALVLTSVVLAKSGISTEEIGRYEMLMYVGTVLTLFWVIGLLQAIVPVHSRLEREEDRRAFIFNQFLVFCGLSLGLCGLLFFGKGLVLPLLTGVSDLPHYGAFCVFLLFNLPSFSVEYLYLLREQPRHILGWGLLSFGLQVLAVWWPLSAGAGLGGSLWALAGLGLLKFLWTLRLVLQRGQVAVRADLVRHYLSFAWPLVLAVLVGNVIVLFDNWLVGWHYNDEAGFAIYRYGAREFPLATALATALGTALIPRLTADFEAGMREMKQRVRRVMHLLFPLTAALMFPLRREELQPVR
ncbi:MAG TPA: oligosaccharide flippase family protein, partial [Saprospiraceae bacterium]|nr:oligosaccharide flippase family protein [Saprospiraceae bacterium]